MHPVDVGRHHLLAAAPAGARAREAAFRGQHLVDADQLGVAVGDGDPVAHRGQLGRAGRRVPQPARRHRQPLAAAVVDPQEAAVLQHDAGRPPGPPPGCASAANAACQASVQPRAARSGVLVVHGWRAHSHLYCLAMKTLACRRDRRCALALPGPAALGRARPRSGALTVEAGDLDRQASPVSVPLPARAGRQAAGAARPRRRDLPLEVDSAGEGRFVLPRLARGKRATYRIAESARPRQGARGRGPGRRRRRLALAGRQAGAVLPGQGRGPPATTSSPSWCAAATSTRCSRPPAGPSPTTIPSTTSTTTASGTPGPPPSTRGASRTSGTWAARRAARITSRWATPSAASVAAGFQAKLSSTDLGATPPKVVIDETWKVVLFRTHPAGKKRLPTTCSIWRPRRSSWAARRSRCCSTCTADWRCAGPSAWLGEQNARFLTSEGKDRVDGENTTARWYFMGGDARGQAGGDRGARAPRQLPGAGTRAHPPQGALLQRGAPQGGDLRASSRARPSCRATASSSSTAAPTRPCSTGCGTTTPSPPEGHRRAAAGLPDGRGRRLDAIQ